MLKGYWKLQKVIVLSSGYILTVSFSILSNSAVYTDLLAEQEIVLYWKVKYFIQSTTTIKSLSLLAEYFDSIQFYLYKPQSQQLQ